MDQGLREQTLRRALTDRLGELRRGDREAPFLEQLERKPVRRAAAPAANAEIDALFLEIHLAMLDLQHDGKAEVVAAFAPSATRREAFAATFPFPAADDLDGIFADRGITAIGILRRDGYEVKTSDFMRIGVPFSLTAVVSGYVLLWIFWH